jgi:Family of unknown function (DUF5689)
MRIGTMGLAKCLARLSMAAVALCIANLGLAQVQFNGGATIDFTGFAGAGFTPSPAAGQLDSDDWVATGLSDGSSTFGGTFTSGDFARGTSGGGVNTGGVYAFDISGNTALGVQPAGSDFTPGTFTLRVQNATGATLNSIDVSYVAYYLNDQPRGNSFNFSYSTDGSSYTGIPALDLVSPDAAAGTWVANPRSTTIVGITVPNGGLFYLRWTGDDVSGGSNRDEFALDDIVLGGGGEPMGACYTNGFADCQLTTQADCANLGGAYDGDGTLCPAPTGACCEGQICTGGITESECLGVGGTYRGDNSDCFTPGICDPGAGACCISGVCQIATSPNDCCGFGGVYLGEGTACDPGACDPVGTIQDTKSASDGDPITVADVVIVSTTDLISSANSKSFTVQDMSGTAGAYRGITVFGPNADIDEILGAAGPGSIISISGELDVFSGLNELSFLTGYQICGSTTTVPSPVAITAANMQDGSALAEALESVLVTLSCVEFNDAGGSFAGGANYTVTDPNSTLSAVVRVATASLDLVGQPIPTGGVAVTGILSQFDGSDPRDGGYQLLVRSISDLTPCGTAVGACFINGGADCIVTTQTDCTSQSGSYQGDGSACPAPTGACCESNGTICTDGISQFDCEQLGGSYRGDDSQCSTPGICELADGACCLGDDTCQIATSPSNCCSLGGVYLGEGTTCISSICDTLINLEERKAIPDGQEITIANVVVTVDTDLVNSANSKSLTVQDMSGPAGADRGYNIFGGNADIDAILAQAPAGSILSITGTTASFNGLSQLVAPFSNIQVCGTTSIAAPVSITTADMQDGAAAGENLESIRVTLSCVTFNDAGGVFAGGMNYTVTDVVSSQTAAVRVQTIDLDLVGQTIPSGQVAITGVLSQFDGSAPLDGGYQLMPVFFADIVPCADPLGACILPDTSCIITSAIDCAGQSGVYQGDASSCPDPTGACCNGAVCTDNVTQVDCENGSGSYQGDGSVCGLDTCVVGQGACCVSGVCQLAADADACCLLGGIFLGEGVACTTGVCDQIVTIDDAKALADGNIVTLGNVILTEVTDLASSANSKVITVQDFSGAGGTARGYSLFGPNADIDALLAIASPGDIISFTAETDSFAGLSEMAAPYSNIQVCGSTTVPAPIAISVADVQEGNPTAEELESVRVTLSCVTFDNAGGIFAGGANYGVTDPNTLETTVVRVQTADLDLVGQTIPSGQVAVTGVLSQFDFNVPADGGYQLLPVSINDIVPCDTGACCVSAAGGSCPTCPGDMNGDNSVNLADIADFVKALLGKPLNNPGAAACANTDLDINGHVNGLDTQAFIGLLASGATCGNTCSVESPTDCATLGGTFLGAGTDCAGDPCNP